jgi:hypothetical protein
MRLGVGFCLNVELCAIVGQQFFRGLRTVNELAES